ncbi:hypothetical protein EIP91_011054 [Steccherinum ochraceum]|uniref:Uncharacterized protein n=1 Tax=Steccherinum ochraceum TaxID=92696 RepID=A0A4R0RUP1_9APHY|nr:hypothetical protein EIP91_011054 [Steccherinum ochraceum]
MHRPRLFQAFSRSKVRRPEPDLQRYDEPEFPYYNNHDDDRYGQASSWRKPNPRDESRPAWEEEVVDYPSRAASYAGPTAYSSRSGRHPVDSGYPEEHISSDAYVDEHYDPDRSTIGGPVPIVQRENSLTRMRDMFTDHGRASHAVTELPLPGNTNRYTVSDLQSPMEVHHTHPSRHQPVIINNTTTGRSIRPDMEHAQVLSERARGKRPEYRRGSSQESINSDSYENEYPPCVVVVERGRHGKPDTYYVIPGGAPVIFEDETGRELTRVGDFSGKYRPRPPKRPVVIQDEYGREVYR